MLFFHFALKEDQENNLIPGNQLKVSKGEWSATGTIVRISPTEEICLELKQSNQLPKQQTTEFTVELVWKSTSYKRMKRGLNLFYKNQKSISSYLYYKLLGIDKQIPPLDTQLQKKISAPNLPDLNIYQIEAVKKAITQPLCLIQGPPGTGKTVTSASIIYQLVQHIKTSRNGAKILVCAPSNIVTDQLAEKVNATGVKVLRLCSKSRETVQSSIEFLTLNNQIRSSKLQKHSKLKDYYEKLDDFVILTPKEEEEFKKLREKAELDLIQNVDVICTTCITSFDPRLKNQQFKYVLIDEATQAIEPECLLPMLKGAKQVILVGDHRQLGPVITCRLTAKAGLNRSMFERFVSMGIRPIRLQVQYRMHPELTTFPSNTFYDGTLQNGITFTDRQFKGNFPWPNVNKPMMFLDTPGIEETSVSGTSYLNRKEAQNVEKMVYYLIKAGVKAHKLGIITPYKGQRAFIQTDLQKNGQLNPSLYKEIEIASVDGFQGREKDFILISCVRSNENVGIGFLTDPRRLNVTLTRARYGMIVLGNAKVLARDKLWQNLLIHFQKEQLLVEGNIPDFRQSNINFGEESKFNNERQHQDDNIEKVEDDSKSTVSNVSNNSNWKYDYIKDFNLNKPINQGYRESYFGFDKVPKNQQFSKVQQTNIMEQDDFIPDLQDADVFHFDTKNN